MFDMCRPFALFPSQHWRKNEDTKQRIWSARFCLTQWSVRQGLYCSTNTLPEETKNRVRKNLKRRRNQWFAHKLPAKPMYPLYPAAAAATAGQLNWTLLERLPVQDTFFCLSMASMPMACKIEQDSAATHVPHCSFQSPIWFHPTRQQKG